MDACDSGSGHKLLIRFVIPSAFLLLFVTIQPAFGIAVQTSPHGPEFDYDCTLCHTVEGWTKLKQPLEFDHSKTDFSLEGRHQQVACNFCHESLQFSQAPTECIGCHLDVHGSQFGNDCDRCHDPENWQNHPKFREMHQETRFPLQGVHAGLDCAACHGDGNYTTLPLDCYGCHLDTWNRTENPNHANAGFSTDCSECHGLQASGWQGNIIAFEHPPEFPLIGGHSIDDCQECHVSGSFSDVPRTCYGCHEEDYLDTDDPDHAGNGFPTDCTVCHNIYDWDDADEFDHTTFTGYELTGAHTSVGCMQCHAEQFAGTPRECAGCHDADFAAAVPDHQAAEFGETCTDCHNTDAWSPAPGFDHDANTDYPLTGEHRNTNCADCHIDNVYDGLSQECFFCHEDDYNETEDPNHLAQAYPTDCEQCHSTAGWEETTFDHNMTEFPLTGAHLELDCIDCHEQGYTGTPTLCFSCHQADFNGATEPIHEAGAFDEDCSVCHTTDTWESSTFNHNQQTNFVIDGSHLGRDCNECHINGTYLATPETCYGCHQADYEDVDDPDHVANNFSTDCTECHNTTDWNDIDDGGIQHGAMFGFELSGAHAGLDCSICHAEGYANTPNVCIGCHQDDFDAAVPPHEPGTFADDCSICHGVDAWSPSFFNHDQQTDFALTGQHLSLDCTLCHVSGVYAGTPAECVGCHQDDYDATTDPNHQSEGFPTDCSLCHTTNGWTGADFNHDNTGFPLTGAHLSVDCALCHIDGYSGTPTECFACHEDDFNNAANPPHDASFGTDCSVCHTTEAGWPAAGFNHADFTGYELTGAHMALDCSLCHADGYADTPTVCFACHEDDFNNTTNPPHDDTFGTDCSVCHTTEADWPAPGFDHADFTGIPLIGAHASLACIDCHADGYDGTPTACIGCHQDDYNGTVDPDHQANNYPEQCTQCHNQQTWVDLVNFNHTLWTDFELTGQHIGLDCSLCHTDGYAGTPTACGLCHQDDWDNAQPPHDPGAFGTDCTTCHTTNGWTPSTFDHNQQTSFDLTGAHITLNCILCHPGGSYTGTPAECFGCHEDDYNNAVDPDHLGAGFPTDCEQCHNTTDWEDAVYSHPWFPIGPASRHEQGNEWDACSDCHPNPNDFTVFTCTNCHLQGETDLEHVGIPGYVYNDAACLNCHPDGEGIPNFFERETDPEQRRRETE